MCLLTYLLSYLLTRYSRPTTCRSASNAWVSVYVQNLSSGYYPLVTIPVGATSVTVREDEVSSNYLGKQSTGVKYTIPASARVKISN